MPLPGKALKLDWTPVIVRWCLRGSFSPLSAPSLACLGGAERRTYTHKCQETDRPQEDEKNPNPTTHALPISIKRRINAIIATDIYKRAHINISKDMIMIGLRIDARLTVR